MKPNEKIICIGTGIVSSHDKTIEDYRRDVLYKENRDIQRDSGMIENEYTCNAAMRYQDMLESAVSQAMKVTPKVNYTKQSRKLGMIVATSLGNLLDMEKLIYQDENEKLPLINGSVYKETRKIAEKFQVNGPCITVSNTCASGINAISIASLWLKNRKADICIVAGVDCISRLIRSGLEANGAITSRRECQVFQKDCDGLLLGEGAGALVLSRNEPEFQEYQLGVISGWAVFNDAKHIMSPDKQGEAMLECVKASLEQADVRANQIDCVCSSANGNYYNDQMNAKVIRELYKWAGMKIPVTSLKHYTGHTLGASVIMEMVGILIMLDNDWICPVSNQETISDEYDDLLLEQKGKRNEMNRILLFSNGFTGVNGVIVVEKQEEC